MGAFEPFEAASRAIVAVEAGRLPEHLRAQFIEDHWRAVLPAVRNGYAQFMERQPALDQRARARAEAGR